jgi:hypothetical protein
LTGTIDDDGISLWALLAIKMGRMMELLLTGTIDDDDISLLALIVSDDGTDDGTAKALDR